MAGTSKKAIIDQFEERLAPLREELTKAQSSAVVTQAQIAILEETRDGILESNEE